MRITDAVDAVRELLQDAQHDWSTKEIVNYLQRGNLSLTRRRTEVDLGYQNYTFFLLEAAARMVRQDVWEYTIPHWVEKVVSVRELTQPATPTQGGLGHIIPPTTKYESGGWRWDGPMTLQLKGYSVAKDLEVTATKRPASPTKGTLPTQANLPTPNTSYVRLDVDTSTDATDYPHETIADSYANSVIEITGATARSGQIRRCVGSTHFQDEGGTLYTVLEVSPAWTTQPEDGDTYEMHLEIEEQHVDLLLKLAARDAWTARGMYDQVKAMAPSLAEQYNEYTRTVTIRQVQTPEYLKHSILPPYGNQSATEDTQEPKWL